MGRAESWVGGLGLALVFVLATPARAEAEEIRQCAPRTLEESLFNPDGDPEKRQEALETTISAAARRGNYAYSRHVLGSLYRLGREHPAALVDRDLDKAKRLLSHAALDGQLMAFAGMAEAELVDDEPMSAMVWAQAFVHYMRKYSSSRAVETYGADLLDRVYARVGRTSSVEQDIAQYVNAFVATHGPKIDAVLGDQPDDAEADDAEPVRTCRSTDETWPLRQVKDEDGPARIMGNRNSSKTFRPGYMMFEIWVDQEGRVVRALVIDALPNRVPADILKKTIEAMRFNAVSPDAPLRVGMVPASFDDNSISLRD